MNDYIDIEDVAPDRQLQRDRFVDFGANGTRGAVSSSWGPADLALAGSGRRSAPAFPLPLLGGPWSDWVAKRAQAASGPADYVAASLLACTGAVLANVRRPLAGTAWSEPPLVWIASVGESARWLWPCCSGPR
jgi:hypothetical protein